MSTQMVAPVIDGRVSVDPLKIAEFEASTPTLQKQAQEFTIEEQSDYEFSLTIAEEAIRRQKAITEFFAPTKKLAYSLHKAITEMEGKLIYPYVVIENLIKNRRMNWRQEQERIRLKAEEEARKAAQDEQQKIALEQAAQLEKEGEHEAAEVVMEQAMSAPAPAVVIQSSVPKQANSAVREEWDFRIDNPDEVQREYCDPSEKKIRAIVKSLGKSAPIKGITIFRKQTEAIRTKGR